ncbi:unnamed protein product [Prunus armeniaca]
MEPAAGPELPSQITCFEILPRLPSKSLMRFRCVCKSWSSLPATLPLSAPIKTWDATEHSPPPHCLGQTHNAATLLLLGNQPTRKFNTRPSSKPSNAANQE